MSRVDARIVRRETHSPRSVAAIVVAILLIAAVVWLAAEGVLSVLGAPPLIVAPRALVAGTSGVPEPAVGVVVVGAVISGVLGLVLLGLAVLPGRRPRRPLAAEHVVVVADDEMLASGLARRAALVAGVAPDAVTVSLGRRRGEVRIVPVSGLRVDSATVRQAVEDEYSRAGSAHSLRFSVRVSPTGKVGS